MNINKQALLSALKAVAPIISSNPIIPAHSGVKITEKYLTGGNSWVSVVVPVSLGIEDCLLDFSILNKAAEGLSGELDVVMNNNVAVLKSIEGKVNVPVIGKVSEYPEMKHEFEHQAFSLTQQDVISLSQLAEFCHYNAGAPYWQGVLYDGDTFSAYDGVVFANYHKPSDFDKKSIFPKDLFKILKNLGGEIYEFSKGIVTAKVEGKPIAFVKYLLINEGFPNVKGFINGLKFDKATSISQYNLSKSFDLLSISTDDATRTIDLNVEPGNGITGITGKEEINTLSEIEIESDNEGVDDQFQISFNFDKLAKGLKFLGGASVKIEMNTPKCPIRVKSDLEGRSIVLAPKAG